ncbi:hypothetical protein XELAEV_18026783mg [Xenopus laevis]|uniref:RNase H type-1 domain-containing protein n=1 Tax=Xenopus laevis TaxID=8355 RepID=A0A974HJ23_XENLA|nr:hypothetical protein XELAEV_18026783mg [Xenopus laevis]
MVSALEAIPFSRFHIRPLQNNFLCQWNKDHKDLQQLIPITNTTKQSLLWWTLPENLNKGRSWAPIHWEVVTTDASLRGWGAVYHSYTLQGRWEPRDNGLPINVLELKAITNALEGWTTLLQHQSVTLTRMLLFLLSVRIQHMTGKNHFIPWTQ